MRHQTRDGEGILRRGWSFLSPHRPPHRGQKRRLAYSRTRFPLVAQNVPRSSRQGWTGSEVGGFAFHTHWALSRRNLAGGPFLSLDEVWGFNFLRVGDLLLLRLSCLLVYPACWSILPFGLSCLLVHFTKPDGDKWFYGKPSSSRAQSLF